MTFTIPLHHAGFHGSELSLLCLLSVRLCCCVSTMTIIWGGLDILHLISGGAHFPQHLIVAEDTPLEVTASESKWHGQWSWHEYVIVVCSSLNDSQSIILWHPFQILRGLCTSWNCTRSPFKSPDSFERFLTVCSFYLARSHLLLFHLPPDPDLCRGVVRGGPRSGIQQTQKPLPQPDARCWCDTDCTLLATQDWHGGEYDRLYTYLHQLNILYRRWFGSK